MRAAGPGDFPVDVEGVGSFVFGKRSMQDQLRIGVEYSTITEGIPNPSPWLDLMATWLSTLRQLTVRAPEGFNPFKLDPLDEDTYANILKVYSALRKKEDSFRRPRTSGVETGGQGNGADAGVLVPAQVQPDALRSQVPGGNAG